MKVLPNLLSSFHHTVECEKTLRFTPTCYIETSNHNKHFLDKKITCIYQQQVVESDLLWAYTSFQSFKHAQFLLKVFLERKIWEKWPHAHDYKKKTSCFNFRIMKPNFNYWKWLLYELTCKMTCKMTFIVQYGTDNGEKIVKEGESNHSVIAV